jgi:hypothetical protein
MDIIFFIAMFVLLLAALGPHHRRTFSLPRAPFGADAHVDRDLDRVLHDVPITNATEHAAEMRRRHRPMPRWARDDHSSDRDRSTGFHLLRLP